MHDGPPTRESLLLRLQRDDQPSWAEFVAIYQPVIYRVARSKGLQHPDAMDASQEVLATVHRSIDSWDPDKAKGSFRGWLYRVTVNTSINALKKAAGQPRSAVDAPTSASIDQIPSLDEADTTLFQLEYRRELFHFAARAVRDEFTDTSWQAFWKTGVAGMDAKTAADELGISVGAVYAAKCRVLSRIRHTAQRLDADDSH